ncbi:MAG: hypothetical protein IRY90_07095, partial [Actinomadura rubrobrunea]|nr:hypothetical protein [Actinomadura rubrobrunea]
MSEASDTSGNRGDRGAGEACGDRSRGVGQVSVTDLGPQGQEFERTPPHDIAAEQGVLGGMLLSQDAIAEVIEVLRTQDFYRPAHQIIFDVILELYGRGDPADAVTVAGELTKRGEIGRVGGAPYLHTLISSVPTAANAGYYAKIVRERSLLRKLVETGTRIVQMGYAADGADADEILDRAQAEIFAIADKRSGEDYAPLSEIMPATLDEIEAIGSRGGQMVGVPTGFADLDALTNGLHPGQMIVVAARPAMGKAVSLDTPLPTPTGWTTMGEVKVGDLLIGADGRPTRVVAATEVMYGRPCYEVEFSDGEVIVADAQHQWRTITRVSRREQSAGASAKHTVGTAVAAVNGAEGPTLHRDATVAVGQKPFHALHAVTRELRQWAGCGTTAAHALTWARSRAAACAPARTAPLQRVDRFSCAVDGGSLAAADAHGVRSGRPSGRCDGRLGRSGTRSTSVPGVSDPARYAAATVHQESIRTTEQIAATLRCDGDGRPNHAVAVAAPFDLPPADLPLDPYPLGVWLAGGDDDSGEITCRDEEILAEIERAGRPVIRHAGPDGSDLPGLRARLRDLGLLREKHIPSVYLRASEKQRRALLAGLLDVGGHVSDNGRVRLGLANRRLAEDVHELIVTLGHQATLTAERPSDGSEVTSTFYRVEFTPTGPVFRLPSKAARQRTAVPSSARVRYIVDVRPVESVPVRCVQVDNDDHMYLVGRSCIPTHN